MGCSGPLAIFLVSFPSVVTERLVVTAMGMGRTRDPQAVVIRDVGPLGLQTAEPLVLIFIGWKPSK